MGTELSGLLAAASLARRGMSVFVLPPIPKTGDGPSVEPHCFFPLNSTYLKSVLGRLGISDEELPRKEVASVFLQVIMPGHRVDLSAQMPIFSEELTREFPAEREAILGLYRTLEDYRKTVDQEHLEDLFLPKTLWDRIKLKRFIRDGDLDRRVSDFLDATLSGARTRPELFAFFESQLRHVSDAFTERPFLYQAAKFLNLSDRGYGEVEGGLESLTRLLIQRILESGGKVLEPRHIEAFEFDRAYLSTVNLGGFDGTIHPKYVLWNRTLRDLSPYLPKGFLMRRFARRIEAFQPTHYRFCVQFTLPRTFWPVGMHDQSLVIPDPSAPLEGDNCLYVQRQSHRREDLLTVSVHYLLPAGALREGAETFSARHTRIRDLLLELMPFTGDELRLAFPILSGTTLDSDNQETLFPIERSPFDVFLEAASLHPVYEGRTESFADFFQIDYNTPIRNLFLTSPEILIQFGLDGKVILANRLSKVLRERALKQQSKALRKRKRMV